MITALPYSELSGKKFEELCYRILLNEKKIPHLFGSKKQYGIDIQVTDSNGNLIVYQCKNWSDVTSGKIEKEVMDVFKNGWLKEVDSKRPTSFILCCRAITPNTKRDTELVKLAKDFNNETNINFDYWDKNYFDASLKKSPDIVEYFFSKDIALDFCEGLNKDIWLNDTVIAIKDDAQIKNDDILKFHKMDKDNLLYFNHMNKVIEKKLDNSGDFEKNILIKGFPSSGKTFLSLFIAKQISQDSLDVKKFIYYLDLKTFPKNTLLIDAIIHRRNNPSVFIIDNCQEDLKAVNVFYNRLKSLNLKHSITIIYIIKSTVPIQKYDLDEQYEFISELIDQQSIIELENNKKAFNNIVRNYREFSFISKEVLENLYSLCCNDFNLLSFILDEYKLSELHNLRIENLFEKVRQIYFLNNNPRILTFERIIKILAISQFDIYISKDFYTKDIGAFPVEDNFITKFSIQTYIHEELKYIFLNPSISEMLFRSLKNTKRNYQNKLLSIVTEYFNISYFKNPGLNQNKYNLNSDLQKFLNKDFIFEKKVNDYVKTEFLNKNEISDFITNHLNLFNYSVLGKIIALTSDSKKYLERILKEIHSFNIIQLFSLIRNTDFENTKLFLESLSKNSAEQIIKSTLTQEIKLGRFSAAIWHLSDINLLDIFEKKFSSKNYVSLLESNCSLIDFIGIIRYSSEERASKIFSSINKELFSKLISISINDSTSIRTYGIQLRSFSNTKMALFEQSIDYFKFSQLLIKKGDLVTFFNILDNTSDFFMKELFVYVNKDFVEQIKKNTLKERYKINILSLLLNKMNKRPDFHIFTDFFESTDFLNLITTNGNLIVLSKICNSLSFEQAKEILDQINPEIAKRLTDRAIEDNLSLGNFGRYLFHLGKIDLLNLFETKIGIDNFFKILTNNGDFISLVDIINEASPRFSKLLLSRIDKSVFIQLIRSSIFRDCSLGTIGLKFKQLKKKSIYSELEKTFIINDILLLFFNNGSIVSFKDLLALCSNEIKHLILEKVTPELIGKLIIRSIDLKVSIDSLSSSLQFLSDNSIPYKLQELVNIDEFHKSLMDTTNIISFLRLIVILPDVLCKTLLQMTNSDSMDQLFNRTAERKNSIGYFSGFLYSLRKSNLLKDFEEKVDVNNYKKIILAKGTFKEFTRIFRDSSGLMQRNIKSSFENSDFQILLNRTSLKDINNTILTFIIQSTSKKTLFFFYNAINKYLLGSFEKPIFNSLKSTVDFLWLFHCLFTQCDIKDYNSFRLSVDVIRKHIPNIMTQQNSYNKYYFVLYLGLLKIMHFDLNEYEKDQIDIWYSNNSIDLIMKQSEVKFFALQKIYMFYGIESIYKVSVFPSRWNWAYERVRILKFKSQALKNLLDMVKRKCL